MGVTNIEIGVRTNRFPIALTIKSVYVALAGMKKIANNLYQSLFDFPFGKTEGEPFCQSAAYLLAHPLGNTLFYSSKYIEEPFNFMAEKRGVSFQMLYRSCLKFSVYLDSRFRGNDEMKRNFQTGSV